VDKWCVFLNCGQVFKGFELVHWMAHVSCNSITGGEVIFYFREAHRFRVCELALNLVTGYSSLAVLFLKVSYIFCTRPFIQNCTPSLGLFLWAIG